MLAAKFGHVDAVKLLLRYAIITNNIIYIYIKESDNIDVYIYQEQACFTLLL